MLWKPLGSRRSAQVSACAGLVERRAFARGRGPTPARRRGARLSLAALAAVTSASGWPLQAARADDVQAPASTADQPTVHRSDSGFGRCDQKAAAGLQEIQPAEVAYHVYGENNDTGIYSDADACHLYAEPMAGSARDRLFVFLGGSKSTPYAYQDILQLAKKEHYYAIDVSYPDKVAVGKACFDSLNPDCTNDFREEVIEGDGASRLVTVDRKNSIVQRLTDFLNYKRGEWKTRFLDRDGKVDWSKIVVAGHSQGSGDALYIAKMHQVLRAVVFSGVSDRAPLGGSSASWLTYTQQDWETPKSSLYAFVQNEDRLGNRKPATILKRCPYPDGDGADIDHYRDNCHDSYQSWNASKMETDHTFTGYAAPAKAAPSGHAALAEHDAPIVDAYTPMRDGAPVYEPIWREMAFPSD